MYEIQNDPVGKYLEMNAKPLSHSSFDIKKNQSVVFVCSGAQSDSELPSHHPNEVSLDRGYTSDSEVYTEHSKARIPRSTTDVDVASSEWLMVSTHTLLQMSFCFDILILKTLNLTSALCFCFWGFF